MSPRVSVRLLQAQPDQRLLALVGSGHERAFEALVLRYRPPLLAHARRLGLGDSRAEDVVQQALLKAWLALREGAVVRDARPWLFAITHNTAMNAVRGRSVEQVPIAAVPELAAVGSVDRRLAAREALSEVAALPPMQRDAVLLSAVEGRSHAEVADALGISRGAVRGLLYRARAALRSAAAALTPQPLLAWATRGGGAPTAGRLLEISAAAGPDGGAGVVKGIALGLTAALAAGAVVVPRAAHHSAHAGLASAASQAGAGGSAGEPSAGTGRSTGALLAPAPGAAVPLRSRPAAPTPGSPERLARTRRGGRDGAGAGGGGGGRGGESFDGNRVEGGGLSDGGQRGSVDTGGGDTGPRLAGGGTTGGSASGGGTTAGGVSGDTRGTDGGGVVATDGGVVATDGGGGGGSPGPGSATGATTGGEEGRDGGAGTPTPSGSPTTTGSPSGTGSGSGGPGPSASAGGEDRAFAGGGEPAPGA